MTKQEIQTNKTIIIDELLAIGREGMADFIKDIEEGGFFDASCNRHDTFQGGTANHSLWALRIARQTAERIKESNPIVSELKDSITIVCLLHDLCDMRYFTKVENIERRHGAYSRRIMESYPGLFTHNELSAVNSHMHGSLYKEGPRSTLVSTDPEVLLHAIVHKSDHKSIEYANDIPYTATPTEPYSPQQIIDNYLSLEKEAGIEYCDFTLYLSNYPDYRSSYIIGQRIDGKWGAKAYKLFLGQDPLVKIYPQAEYIYDTEKKAIESIRHGRKQYRRLLDNPIFYRRYTKGLIQL